MKVGEVSESDDWERGYDQGRDSRDDELEFVGWMCPAHRRVVRPNPNGSRPAFHLISKDEGKTQCTLNPDLWMRTFVERPDQDPPTPFNAFTADMIAKENEQ